MDFKILALWMLNNTDGFITLTDQNKNINLLPYNEVLNKHQWSNRLEQIKQYI